MDNTKIGLFLRAKVKRSVDWYGNLFTFTHIQENKYHQEESTVTNTIKGVYHEATSYANKTSTDGSVISKKHSPMILCLFEEGSKISVGDKAVINGDDYIVTGIENVQQLDVAIQISLVINE